MYDDIIKGVGKSTENVSQAMLDIFSRVTEIEDYEVVEILSDRTVLILLEPSLEIFVNSVTMLKI